MMLYCHDECKIAYVDKEQMAWILANCYDITWFRDDTRVHHQTLKTLSKVLFSRDQDYMLFKLRWE